MKVIPSSKSLRLIGAGMILTGSVLLGQAQPYPSYIIDQFDTDTTGFYQNQGWGTAVPSFSFNAANATPGPGLPNNPGSGSMQWQSSWSVGGDQIMVDRGFNTINILGDVLDFSQYTNISFDVQFQSDSSTNAQGNYSSLEIDAIPQSDGWPSTYIGTFVASGTNGNNWIHASVTLPTGISKLSAVTGYGIKVQEGNSGQVVGNVTDFLIDNIVLGGNQTVPPPPTMSISKVVSPPGLAVVAEGGGNQYVRALLMSQDAANGLNFSWVGASGPVTYSRTIARFPDTNHIGFQSVLFMVPNGANGDQAIDYDAANVIQVTVTLNADGSAFGAFQFKTNQPSGNSQFAANTLGSLSVPGGALGTWSVTFVNNTNVTFSGPGGSSTNFLFPSDVVSTFANPLSIYYGIQQGGTTANIGEYLTYSQLTATGLPVSTSFTDNFNTNAIDTSIWQVIENTAPFNLFVLQSGNNFLTKWTQPDAGFVPNISPKLGTGASWSVVTTNYIHTSLWDGTVLSKTSVPTNSNWFVRLVK
jgi:hypothetical protein